MAAGMSIGLLLAACTAVTPVATPGPATLPASPAPATLAPGTTTAATEIPNAILAKRGFPTECPDVSTTFDLMNQAAYQVFAEQGIRDQQGQARLVHVFLGTAWALTDRVLATNAHVAAIFTDSAAQGVQFDRAIAVQSGTGTVIRLVRGVIHPQYDSQSALTPDVGLFESEQPLPVVLPLAPADSVLALGDQIQIVGFPGDVDTVFTVVPGQTVPQATSLSGQITARRSRNASEPVTPATLASYQHQAPTTPGTSGSSMVHCGLVAGINNAGTVRFVLTPDPEAEGGIAVERQAAAANNFAVHVRHIHELVQGLQAGTDVGFALPVTAVAVADPSPIGSAVPGATGQSIDPAQLIGTYSAAVSEPMAQHEFTFTVAAGGVIQGTSSWPETGQFVLAGQVAADGTFLLADDAPERLGFRRGVYQGTIGPDGSVVGTYFEQTQEQTMYPFAGQKTGQ